VKEHLQDFSKIAARGIRERELKEAKLLPPRTFLKNPQKRKGEKIERRGDLEKERGKPIGRRATESGDQRISRRLRTGKSNGW